MTIPVRIKTDFIDIDTTIDPNQAQRDAAWELYVELLTRVATAPLPDESGLLREAMNSLYTLFACTRTTLKSYGPRIARKTRKAEYSVGYLAIAILNRGLRPFLSKWHPLLLDHEEKRPNGLSSLEHEKQWGDCYEECRADLKRVRQTLAQYSDILATICDVPKYATDRKKMTQ